MTQPSIPVFLSYASQDAESAQRICEALRAAGIEVWFDQSELRGGDAWDRQIRKQIHDCALFIPIISAVTQGRLEGYFRREWRLAVDRTHDMADGKPFLVPVVIDDTRDQDAEVPDSFRAVQWTRLRGGDASPDFVERVSRLLSPAPTDIQSKAAAAPYRAATPQRTPATPQRLQPVLLLVAALAVIGVGYFALDKFVLSKRPSEATQLAAPTSISAPTPAPSTIPEKSIAVMPFIDMSEKHDQEYFGDGMAEEILNLLVKIPELKVIGRTSSFQFKGKTDDLRKIGSTLGAAYVVDGSVRRSGNHIRVTAQLVDALDGRQRWSETYDRDASDALKVQTEIVGGLVRALQVEVTSSSHLHGHDSVRNIEAYDNYLRGLHAEDRGDQQGLQEAVADFRRALSIDHSFAPAAEELADALGNMVDGDFVPPKPGWEQARLAAMEALNLNPQSSHAHALLGYIHVVYDWDWSAADEEGKRALALSRNDPEVLMDASRLSLALGRWNESADLLEAAASADPLSYGIYISKGWAYERLLRLAEAEAAYRRAVEITPTAVWLHFYLGRLLLLEGHPDAALAEFVQEGHSGARSAGLAMAYFSLHRFKESDAALAKVEHDNANDMGIEIAEEYAFRGAKDKAFEWLETAYRTRDADLYYVKGDPLLRNLEGDPRYKKFLHKMNLPE